MSGMHELKNVSRPAKARKRVGRGVGSRQGKTCGRGSKGAGSRSGYRRRLGYEGGQMRLYMKLPSRGFSNFNFRNGFAVINLYRIEEAFNDGEEVTLETLKAKRMIKTNAKQVKILGDGELTKKVKITVHAATSKAKEKLQEAKIPLTLIS